MVLGTSRAHVSTDDDFDNDDHPERSYISIEEERRHIDDRKKRKEERKKKLDANKRDPKKLPDAKKASPPESIKMAIELFMNLISFNVNKIHIRFEDDFFTGKEKPYSFGFTINSLNINSTDKEIKFDKPLDLQYKEFEPDDNKNLFLKHILIKDVGMYWNHDSDIYVPHRLQEETIHKSQKIFDYSAHDPEEFRKIMLLPFKDIQKQKRRGTMTIQRDDSFHYLLDRLTIDINMSYYRLKDEDVRKNPHHRFSLTALVSPVRLAIKPHLLDSVKLFMEYMQYQNMLPFLKRYKPRRRPLTTRSRNPNLAQVRRQIVKDWFSLVIWANRLKKVLANDIAPEFHEEEIENNKVKYDKALARLQNPRDNELLDRHLGLDRGHEYNHLDKMVAPVIDEIYQRQEQEQADANNAFFKNFLQKFFIVFKVQSVCLELYQSTSPATYRGEDMPSLQIVLGRLRLGLKLDNARLNSQILLEDIKIMDTLIPKTRGGASRNTTMINETLNVKTGFILDEDVSQFFKRHEQNDSIFDNKNYENPYSRMTGSSRLEPEEVIGGLRINERPRKHHYGEKSFGDQFTEQKSRFENPDQLIDFTGHGYQQEKENHETSKFNFEGFWKKKIGKLIGLNNDEEVEERKYKTEHNNLLDAVTTSYQDDNGRDVYERCFLLAEGEPQFLELNFATKLFANPKDKQAINVGIDIKNIRIEYANDLVKTLAEVAFAFRNANSLGEVKIAGNPDVFQRKIEVWTPWYLVAQAFTTHGFDDYSAKKGFGKAQQEENTYIAQENAKKQARQTQTSLANLDKQLQKLDVKLVLAIEGLYLSLNTNYENKRNLLQIKTDPIQIILIKQAKKFGLSVMGIQIMTQSSFELLFQFSQQMQKTLAIYLDNPVMKDAKKLYQDILTKRIVEARSKGGMNPGLMNIDASTIKPSGRGTDNFSMSEAPRFSTTGGTTTFGAAGGSRGTAVNKPRNRPTLDFGQLRPANDRLTTVKTTTQAPVGSARPAKSMRQIEDEFADASFNDTDEDIKFSDKDIKSPNKNTAKKLAQYQMDSPTQYNSEVRYSPVKSPVAQSHAVGQPRTGPSRRAQKGLGSPRVQTVTTYEAPMPTAQPRTGPSRRNRTIHTPAYEEEFD